MAPADEEGLVDGGAQPDRRQLRPKTNCQIKQRCVYPAILYTLDGDVGVQVFSHLRARDLARMAAVARRLREGSYDARLWTQLCVSRWPATASPALHAALARRGARSFYRSRLAAELPR